MTRHICIAALQDFDLNRIIDNITAKQNQLAELERKAAHFKVRV